MIIYIVPLHKRQCLATIIFTNLSSLHPLSFIYIIILLFIWMHNHKDLLSLSMIFTVATFLKNSPTDSKTVKCSS